MKKLRAAVDRSTGKARHAIGSIESGKLCTLDTIECPSFVEIVEYEDGTYLFRYDAAGVSTSDTWHESVADAKKQAEFEFEIPSEGWEEME